MLTSKGKKNAKVETSSKSNNNDYSTRSFKTYFLSTRPWSFSASVTPVLLGNVLAFTEFNSFNVYICALTLVCVIFVHCAGNLTNTYYDFKNGVDKVTSDDKTLVVKILNPEEVLNMAAISYGIGLLAFIFIVLLSKATFEHLVILFVIGLAGSFLYSGSIGLKYYALGDIVIILTFGPLSVGSSFVVQTGVMTWSAVLFSVPLISLTEAILHGNNSRDCKDDEKAGIKTLAMFLGKTYSYILYVFLLLIPYQYTIMMSVSISKYFCIPLFTIPLALELEKKFRLGNLRSIPQETARLNLLFGLLYILVFIIDWWLLQK